MSGKPYGQKSGLQIHTNEHMFRSPYSITCITTYNFTSALYTFPPAHQQGSGSRILAIKHTLMVQNARSCVHAQNTFGKRISDTT